CGSKFAADGGSSIGRYRGALPGNPDRAVGII
ncbi:MAG: hypothetical protein JWM91_1219, partial [Rhodospirillales bacterium]|nr:hypothetical protein [Rhodospirillales bacterium]